MTERQYQQAYDEGKEAGKAGHPLTDTPYIRGNQWHDWVAGWYAGRKERFETEND